MEQEQYLKSADGTEIFLKKHIAETDNAVLVMAHGLGEHTGTFDYMAQAVQAAGISTYRPDHRGHGRSGGERAHLDDFNQLLDDFHLAVTLAMEENPEKPVFLYGHSMGGFTVSLYSIKYPNERIRGVITSGAVVRENRGLFRSVEAGRDVHERIPNTLHEELCTVPERVVEFRSDPLSTLFNTVGTAYEICRGDDWFESRMSDFAYPVFMIHGEDDCVVSVKDTYDFFSAVRSLDKQMKIYGKGRHAIFNEFCRDEVIGDCISWIKRRSGAEG